MSGEEESSNDLSPPFKEKEKEGEGRFKACCQWKEKEKVFCLVVNGRKRIKFFVWWPMEGEGESSLLDG
jgi:hypothetical protein